MKQLLVGIALLLVMALFCTVNHFVCCRIARDTLAPLDRLDASAGEKSYARWKQGCRYLEFVIPNDHLRAVDEQFASLQDSIKNGDRRGALTTVAVLRSKLDAITNSASLKLGDLF